MVSAAIIAPMVAALALPSGPTAQAASDQALFDQAFRFCLATFEARASGAAAPEGLDWNGRPGVPLGVWDRERSFVMLSADECVVTQDRSAPAIAAELPATLESLGFSPNPEAGAGLQNTRIWDRPPLRIAVEQVTERRTGGRMTVVVGMAKETD